MVIELRVWLRGNLKYAAQKSVSWAATLFGSHSRLNDIGYKVLRHVRVTSDIPSDDTISERPNVKDGMSITKGL